MKVRYDEEADALYIRLRKGEYYESDEIQEGFILDYDIDGNVIGIEILEASIHLDPADLSTVNFEISRQLMKTGEKGLMSLRELAWKPDYSSLFTHHSSLSLDFGLRTMDYGPVTNDSIAANGRACSNWQIKAYFQQAVIVPVTLQRESGDSRSDPRSCVWYNQYRSMS